MSAYTKRKHVSKEVEEFDELPTDKSIVKIIGGKGKGSELFDIRTFLRSFVIDLFDFFENR